MFCKSTTPPLSFPSFFRFRRALLTPNIMEATRLYKAVLPDNEQLSVAALLELPTTQLAAWVHTLAVALDGPGVLVKGATDIVGTADGVTAENSDRGSPRRCGGQVRWQVAIMVCLWIGGCNSMGIRNSATSFSNYAHAFFFFWWGDLSLIHICHQGDLTAGSAGTFLNWALRAHPDDLHHALRLAGIAA